MSHHNHSPHQGVSAMESSLTRYLMSIVLSYCAEDDGLSLLLTNKVYAYQVLRTYKIHPHQLQPGRRTRIRPPPPVESYLTGAGTGGSDEKTPAGAVSAAAAGGGEDNKNGDKPATAVTEKNEDKPAVTEEKKNDGRRAVKEEKKNDDKPAAAVPVARAPPAFQRRFLFRRQVIEDPDTLLARLNTRRLCKRILYLKKHDELSGEAAYPYNTTTEDISWDEWNAMLKYKLPPVPSSQELLLFSPCPRAVCVLASYPRSGNTLMRTLYEKTSLRVTGSDMRGGLTKHDVIGEAAVSTNKVQFVKTHYPERRGFTVFPANRVVLLVRNPYDAIESYFNLMMTATHTTSLTDEEREKYKALWEEMVLKEIEVWKRFHKWWLSQKIRMLLVRYEDLTRYPEQVMAKVLQFILEVKNMKFFNWRIDRCFSDQEIEKLGSYKPRSGGIGKSLARYSPELHMKMSVGLMDLMKEFGYEEMLVPNKDKWLLDPMEDFGQEIIPDEIDEIEKKSRNIVKINGGKLVRGPKLNTNWKQVKRGDKAGECTCYNCRNRGKN